MSETPDDLTLEDAVMRGIEHFSASRSYVGTGELSEKGKLALRSHVTAEVQRGLRAHMQSLAAEIVPKGDQNELDMAYNVIVALLLRYASGNGTELAPHEIERARNFILEIEREDDTLHFTAYYPPAYQPDDDTPADSESHDAAQGQDALADKSDLIRTLEAAGEPRSVHDGQRADDDRTRDRGGRG